MKKLQNDALQMTGIVLSLIGLATVLQPLIRLLFGRSDLVRTMIIKTTPNELFFLWPNRGFAGKGSKFLYRATFFRIAWLKSPKSNPTTYVQNTGFVRK